MKLTFLGNRYETTEYSMLPTEESGVTAQFMGNSYRVRKATSMPRVSKPRMKYRGASY